jgi:hypothetical protein
VKKHTKLFLLKAIFRLLGYTDLARAEDISLGNKRQAGCEKLDEATAVDRGVFPLAIDRGFMPPLTFVDDERQSCR